MPHKRTDRFADTAAVDSPEIGSGTDGTSRPCPTGLYLRISGQEAAEGEKLSNQKDLLLNYAKSRNDLKIVDIYSDNGKTGTDFNRPEWIRLMEDVKRKRISCIVVKDHTYIHFIIHPS